MPTNPGPHQSMKLVLLNHFGETVALLLRESSFRKTQGTVISSLAAFLTQSQSPHLNFSLRWPLSDSSWLYKYIYIYWYIYIDIYIYVETPSSLSLGGSLKPLWDKKQLRYCRVSAGWFYKGCLLEEAGVSRKTLETFINISEPWSSENWSLIKASWDTVQLPICMAMYFFFPSPKLRPFPSNAFFLTKYVQANALVLRVLILNVESMHLQRTWKLLGTETSCTRIKHDIILLQISRNAEGPILTRGLSHSPASRYGCH